MKRFYLICLLMGMLSLNSCFIGREMILWFPGIKDYKHFPEHALKPSDKPFHFTDVSGNMPTFKLLATDNNKSFEEKLKDSKTVAFIIIRNDSILYKKYLNGYNESSLVTSFSMAKSFISSLIGFAIQDGLIPSVDEPIGKYIPELKDSTVKAITIKQLLQMTSGLKYKESYNSPFASIAMDYYGSNLARSLKKLHCEVPPGTRFKYQSINTQLLGFVLKNVLNGKTLADYLEEKIWTPVGMEAAASWSIDSRRHNMEKAYCGINAKAIDFAKFGRLYLHKGNWNGRQLLNQEWVATSTKIDSSESSKPYYQYQWWIPAKNGSFVAVGYLGQYIYIDPEKDLLILRFGKNEGNVPWYKILTKIAEKM